MRLIGMMAARNEAYEIGLTARVALRWLDALVILDHASTDRTPDIIAELREESGIDRVLPIACPDPKWDEMAHRQLMLYAARRAGATHLAIIDADEVATGDMLSSMRDAALSTRPGHMLQLPLYNLRGGIDRYHSNGVWGNRIVDLAFADDARLGWSGDKFHSRAPTCSNALPPSGFTLQPYRPIAQGEGGILHLWGSSERRLRAKSAWYKVTERLRWPDRSVAKIDQMYSWAIKGGDPYETADKWTYAPVPAAWWEPHEDLIAEHLHVDEPEGGGIGGAWWRGLTVPWQEQAVRAAVAEHGRERFVGLDLFGL